MSTQCQANMHSTALSYASAVPRSAAGNTAYCGDVDALFIDFPIISCDAGEIILLLGMALMDLHHTEHEVCHKSVQLQPRKRRRKCH